MHHQRGVQDLFSPLWYALKMWKEEHHPPHAYPTPILILTTIPSHWTLATSTNIVSSIYCWPQSAFGLYIQQLVESCAGHENQHIQEEKEQIERECAEAEAEKQEEQEYQATLTVSLGLDYASHHS